MGIWKSVENILYKAVGDIEKKKKNIEDYKELYKRYDNDRLLREYRRSSGECRIACGMLLKERGYENLD